ncbi:rhox homeobox family member 2 [Phodopus roborovskii]|nr:rhox homeobox family member 2 [Phodopus roborovskii]
MDSIQVNKVLPIGEESKKEESGHGEPGWGATATQGESEKELSDDMNKEGGGAAVEGHNSEQQPNELIPRVMEDERVQSVPRQVPRRRLRHRFTQWQLEELERIFQTNRFLSIEARKQLARWMGVNEARVKRWFQKRREQYRRYKRL